MNKQTINTQDASTSLDLKGDQKDDWTIVTPIDASGVFKLPVPSFIRLFTIRRIICTHMSDNNIDLTKDSFLQQISSKLDADTRLNALNIVTQLVNHGIKKYMVSCYHEKKDASLIEIIFNKIILNKFQKEYSQLITHNNTNNNKYQNSVFNTDVLMCKILEYLTFDVINGGDLLNCNLVNSQWLYQVWNPHLISKVNLSDLIKHQYKYNDNCNNNENNNNNININIASMWQRVLNAKDIGLHLDKYNPKITYNNDDISLLQRLSMFKNIESICGTIHSKHISILKALISQCKDKIEKYDVSIMSDKIKNDDEKNVLSPLVLVNANHIATQSEYFYIKWSNKCKKLSLTNFKDICKQWCQYVIDNCDCSSIEILNLIDASFNFINAYVLKKDSDKMLENLAKKFSNLKRLQLVYDNYRSDSYMLLFAKYLLPIIEKNNPIETRYVKCIQDYKAEVIDEYEMSIFEGEIIQVHYRNCDFGEEDWWHGSSMFQQRHGYFPSNYTIAYANSIEQIESKCTSTYVIAIGYYEACSDDEVTINVGDVIDIHQRTPSGWWYGTNSMTNKEGWLPRNYVKEGKNVIEYLKRIFLDKKKSDDFFQQLSKQLKAKIEAANHNQSTQN